MKVKQTNDGKKGGLLKGKPHYDKDGNSLGGIKAVVSDSGNRPVELEGGEVIINKEASKKHWKLLSKINQSAGGGVPIGPPSGADFDEDPEEFKEGGRIIEFNPNHVPNKWVVQYAEKIKKENPEIWKLGGNIFGNQAFENLLRVSKRGHWLDSEEWMYIKWRSYVARHKGDFRIEGVVAMLKWCDKVEKGWAYMKDLIEEKIDKIESKKEKATSKMATGGGVEKENDTAKSLRERYRKLWRSLDENDISVLLNSDYAFEEAGDVLGNLETLQEDYKNWLKNKGYSSKDSWKHEKTFLSHPIIAKKLKAAFSKKDKLTNQEMSKIEKQLFSMYPVLVKVKKELDDYTGGPILAQKIYKSGKSWTIVVPNYDVRDVYLSLDEVDDLKTYIKESTSNVKMATGGGVETKKIKWKPSKNEKVEGFVSKSFPYSGKGDMLLTKAEFVKKWSPRIESWIGIKPNLSNVETFFPDYSMDFKFLGSDGNSYRIYSPGESAKSKQYIIQKLRSNIQMANGGGVDNIEPEGYKKQDAIKYGKKLVDANLKYIEIRNKIEENYAGLRSEIQDVLNSVLDYYEKKPLKQNLPQEDKIASGRINELSATLLNQIKRYAKENYNEDVLDDTFMLKGEEIDGDFQVEEVSIDTVSGRDIHITIEKLFMKRGGELSKGIRAELEHKKTIDKIYNRKVSISKAPELIAKDHLKEDPKYYSKLEQIEGKKFADGGKIQIGIKYLIGKPEISSSGRFGRKRAIFKTIVVDEQGNKREAQINFAFSGSISKLNLDSYGIRITQKEFDTLYKKNEIKKFSTGSSIEKFEVGDRVYLNTKKGKIEVIVTKYSNKWVQVNDLTKGKDGRWIATAEFHEQFDSFVNQPTATTQTPTTQSTQTTNGFKVGDILEWKEDLQPLYNAKKGDKAKVIEIATEGEEYDIYVEWISATTQENGWYLSSMFVKAKNQVLPKSPAQQSSEEDDEEEPTLVTPEEMDKILEQLRNPKEPPNPFTRVLLIPKKEPKIKEPEPVKRKFKQEADYLKIFTEYFEKDTEMGRPVKSESYTKAIVNNFIIATEDIGGFSKDKLKEIKSFIDKE